MKRLLAAIVTMMLMLGVVSAQEAAKPKGKKSTGSGDVTQTLTNLENQWTKAAKESNGDAIAPLLADKWVTIDSDGSMHDKADAVARAKKAKWETNEISDLKVTQYGNSAVVTGTWVGKGTDGSGKRLDAKERWADTWVKMPDGKWKCVASASAPMK